MGRLTQAVTILTRSLFISTRTFHATACRLSEIDITQEELLKEALVMVDESDCVTGYETKRDCHLKKNILQYGMLHRAFSVFLFNKQGELLLQQRSNEKITFPGYITNSCCSHPLYDVSELDEYKHTGIRRAAKRRLSYELGIPGMQSFAMVTDLEVFQKVIRKQGPNRTSQFLCCQQGSYGSWKTWKVLEFYSGIFQDWKVLEKGYWSWKVLEIC